MKELIFSKIVGPFPVTLLKKPPLQEYLNASIAPVNYKFWFIRTGAIPQIEKIEKPLP